MNLELPAITASSYTANTAGPDLCWERPPTADLAAKFQNKPLGAGQGVLGLRALMPGMIQPKESPMANTARIVKVFIADTNENLPLDRRVIHSGAEQLTDLTDQELFFEVPIAELLSKHNEVRKATLDKNASEKFGRDIFLEPVRIRDLKMVVVTVAQF